MYCFQSVDLGNPLGKIAAKFHVDVQTVERFFEVDDDGVHLLIPTRSLSSKKQQATQEVAYLVAAGRQAIGLEEFTGWKTIRDTCENRGVPDSSNFGLAMGKLDGDGLRIKGKGGCRELKINAAGYEKAGEIITRMAGEGAK